MNHVALFYKDEDRTAAFKLFVKAAALGDAEAMRNVGTCYWQGAGVAEDRRATHGWYRKAAALGNSDAMSRLCQCYQRGLEVAPDQGQAAIWFWRGADWGDAVAAFLMRLLLG
jgi:TPR repeat protein